MKADFEIKDQQKIVMSLKKLPGKMFAGIMDVLIDISNDIRNEILTSMKSTKRSSNFYMRGSKKHFSSEYGNPPAIDSGGLIGSIIVDVRKRNAQVEVGSETGAPYAKYLENAENKADPHKRERKFLQPAIDKQAAGIETKLLNAIQRAVKL